MQLPYPNDPASLSQPNPLFNDNSFVRGDQFRLNNSRAWSNFDFLMNYLNYSMFGFVSGRLNVLSANPTVIRIPVNNAYDVNSILQFVDVEKTLDFSGLTNIFRTDGTTQITNVSETQNKHLYLLLTDTGILQAMIIPNTDIVNHSYLTNPLLLEAYYTGTPAIWYPLKNGYYRNSKRIIATLRLDGSNNIQFFYELDRGYRFQDVANIAIGNLYTENRYGRSNPNCYLLDGSTITNMSTEAPFLYRLLGSNVLPDYTDIFLRNIDVSGARSIRDFQDFAVEDHTHNNAHPYYGTAADPTTAISLMLTTQNIAPNNEVTGVRTGNVDTETRPKNRAVSIQIVRG